MTGNAKAKVDLTIRRAAARYPFHAAILERFQVAADPTVQTMGVMATANGVRLLYDEQFVLGLPNDQLLGVLLHEVHHVLFRHILADPKDYPDEWARIVAEEVTVNEFVGEPLPAGGILLKDFPDLPAMESTRQRYARLRQRKNRFPINGPGLGTVSSRGSARNTIDNHSIWDAANVDSDAAAGAIQDLIDNAATAAGPGNVPGQFQELLSLHDAAESQLDWKSLLRRYAGQCVQITPRLDYPSRRLPHLVGVVPGRSRRTERPRIMAVIDTSGSVTAQMLSQISGELSNLARNFDVTVVECDQAIHDVYPYRPITKVVGRGGTDFRPPLKKEFLQQHRPDLVVYFTDGIGSAPKNRPAVRVVWCLVPGGESPATWGQVIQMR